MGAVADFADDWEMYEHLMGLYVVEEFNAEMKHQYNAIRQFANEVYNLIDDPEGLEKQNGQTLTHRWKRSQWRRLRRLQQEVINDCYDYMQKIESIEDIYDFWSSVLDNRNLSLSDENRARIMGYCRTATEMLNTEDFEDVQRIQHDVWQLTWKQEKRNATTHNRKQLQHTRQQDHIIHLIAGRRVQKTDTERDKETDTSSHKETDRRREKETDTSVQLHTPFVFVV